MLSELELWWTEGISQYENSLGENFASIEHFNILPSFSTILSSSSIGPSYTTWPDIECVNDSKISNNTNKKTEKREKYYLWVAINFIITPHTKKQE